VYNSI